MLRNAVALVLLLGVETASAEPYRPLPRISAPRARARAARAAATGAVLAQEGRPSSSHWTSKSTSQTIAAAGRPLAPGAPVTGTIAETSSARLSATLSSAQLTIVRDSHSEDGRTVQVMSDGSGALLEVVRDARGLLLSARDFAEP